MKNPMTAFVMFALNYPANFIEEAFPNNSHLKSKWDTIDFVTPNEGYGRMVKFWSLLSDDNRDTLTEYIYKYYKMSTPELDDKIKREEAIEECKNASIQCQCTQHVNKKANGIYYVSDWFDSDSTIATFTNGNSH